MKNAWVQDELSWVGFFMAVKDWQWMPELANTTMDGY